jgi:membrane-bound hydrogenase subunit alpha
VKKTLIPLGPLHPLLEEPEFFQFYVEGEKIVDADLRIGYNHRAIEKLSESKAFHQVVFLVERICGICSTSHPIAYVNAVEDLLGIEAPERALYIRSIIGELERIHSHLLWFGLAGHFIGYNTVFMWAWKYRETILDICERVAGNRNHYGMMKIGGVVRDIRDEDVGWITESVRSLTPKIDMLTQAVLDDPVIRARLEGVGVLTYEDAVRYGVTGPTARASGYDIDVRRDDPYAAYGRVDWKVIVRQGGDVLAKSVVRLLEIIESVSIIEQCLAALPAGPIEVEVREIPPGEGIGRHEAPRGEVFHYVRSDGSNHPVRHKIRAPSYVNIPSFQATCIGESIADAALITAAVDPCYCCTERMGALDRQGGETAYTAGDLLRLSWAKTEELRRTVGAGSLRGTLRETTSRREEFIRRGPER